LIWAKDSISDIVQMNDKLIEYTLEEILDLDEDDEVEINGDLVPVLMQQAAPVMAVGRVAKEFKIAFYAGKLPAAAAGGITLHRYMAFT
jgi:hypothetical protein